MSKNEEKWKTADPSVMQLYSLRTPNGQKVSIMLEELGLKYEAHTVDILSGDQFRPEFVAMNPNSKIPVLLDPEGPDGSHPYTSMESGAILLYLAEKHKALIPENAHSRYECIQWLFFQMASIGPMFGQFGHFYKYASQSCDHPYPVERYTKEAKRLLAVLDKRLQEVSSGYLLKEGYSIADIATFPWVLCLDQGYQAADHLELEKYGFVQSWVDSCIKRPAVQRGLSVCPL